MTALTLQWRTLDCHTALRGVAAGGAWGVTVAAALLGLSLYNCGTVCLGQIVDTTALSVLAGIVAIGSLALFRRPAQIPAQ